jgi:hypothetical protein
MAYPRAGEHYQRSSLEFGQCVKLDSDLTWKDMES